MGELAPTPRQAGEVRRVLVFRGGAIGDFILTLPALAALRRAYPGAHVTLVGNAQTMPLALLGGYADEAHSADASWVASLFAEQLEPSPDTFNRLGESDLAVVWLRVPEGAVARYLRSRGIPTLAALSFPLEYRRHVADHLLSTLSPLGVPAGPAVPRLGLPPAALAAAEALWTQHSLDRAGRVVAIHPGSGGARKNWPAARFARVADRLAEKMGVKPLLIVGPADERPAEDVLAAVKVARPVPVMASSLTELAAILARCDAYLGNDSGVTHLASAVGAAAVAIFGPTDPAVWAPRGDRVEVLWKGTPAGAADEVFSGGGKPGKLGLGGVRGEDAHGRVALEAVEEGEVFDAVERLLGGIVRS